MITCYKFRISTFMRENPLKQIPSCNFLTSIPNPDFLSNYLKIKKRGKCITRHMATAGLSAGLEDDPHPALAPHQVITGYPFASSYIKGSSRRKHQNLPWRRGLHFGKTSRRTKHFSWDLRPSQRKRLQVECQKHRRAPYSQCPHPFPCIGHHFPQNSSLALFYLTDSSMNPVISNNSQ